MVNHHLSSLTPPRTVFARASRGVFSAARGTGVGSVGVLVAKLAGGASGTITPVA